mmetsp:Transcript_22088/g.21792  ORF Transcript_22088/g.21792 Transcript_22088/m.21792 type:complete len:256 (+) Transcript_22088:14-781(+)
MDPDRNPPNQNPQCNYNLQPYNNYEYQVPYIPRPAYENFMSANQIPAIDPYFGVENQEIDERNIRLFELAHERSKYFHDERMAWITSSAQDYQNQLSYHKELGIASINAGVERHKEDGRRKTEKQKYKADLEIQRMSNETEQKRLQMEEETKRIISNNNKEIKKDKRDTERYIENSKLECSKFIQKSQDETLISTERIKSNGLIECEKYKYMAKKRELEINRDIALLNQIPGYLDKGTDILKNVVGLFPAGKGNN